MIYHHVFDNPGLDHFSMSAQPHAFYLHYARKGAVKHHYSGIGSHLIPEEHFQVYFIGAGSQVFEFKSPGKYSLLSISFSADWIEPFSQRFLTVSGFLKKAETGIPAILFKNPQPMTAENKRLINDVFADTWDNDHVKHMTRLVLLPSLKQAAVFAREEAVNAEDAVFAVAEWLLLHPDESASITTLAREFLVNEHKLKNDFKKRFGMPVITFQRKVRIEKAKQMLGLPGIPISEVARSSGFRQTTYFSDFFRRETGLSPSDYRRTTNANETASLNTRE